MLIKTNKWHQRNHLFIYAYAKQANGISKIFFWFMFLNGTQTSRILLWKKSFTIIIFFLLFCLVVCCIVKWFDLSWAVIEIVLFCVGAVAAVYLQLYNKWLQSYGGSYGEFYINSVPRMRFTLLIWKGSGGFTPFFW